MQEQHAAVAAALVIGDGVAEFVVRKTEAARVKLMSVSDDTIQKARRYHFGPFYWFCVFNVLTSSAQATKIQAVVRGHLARTLRKQVLVTP